MNGPVKNRSLVGSGFPPSLRFRLRAKRSGATSTKLEERSRVGEARRSAKRGGGSQIGEIRPKADATCLCGFREFCVDRRGWTVTGYSCRKASIGSIDAAR